MKVLAQLRDGHNCSVRYLPAFCQDQVSKTWSCLDNLLDASVLKFSAVCQIEDAQALKGNVLWKVEKRVIRNPRAVCKTKLAELMTLVDESSNCVIFEISAVCKVNLEDGATVLGECND